MPRQVPYNTYQGERTDYYRSRRRADYAWEDWLANRSRQAELAPWAHRLDKLQAEDAYRDYRSERARQQEAYNRSHSGYYQMDFDPSNPYGQTYRGPGGQTVALNDRTKDKWDYGSWNADPFKGFINKDKRINSLMMGGRPILSKDQSGNVSFGGPQGFGGLFGSNLGDSNLKDFSVGAAPSWSYNAPAAWEGYEFDVTAIDPRKAMEAQVPWFQEQLGDALAEVTASTAPAMRGFTGDSGYVTRMSDEGRRWNEDFQRVVQQMMLEASTANARNQLEADIAKQNASLNAWATQGGWGHEAQLAQNAYQGDMWGRGAELELRRRMGLDDYDLSKFGIEANGIGDIIASLGQFLG